MRNTTTRRIRNCRASLERLTAEKQGLEEALKRALEARGSLGDDLMQAKRALREANQKTADVAVALKAQRADLQARVAQLDVVLTIVATPDTHDYEACSPSGEDVTSLLDNYRRYKAGM